MDNIVDSINEKMFVQKKLKKKKRYSLVRD